MNNLIAIDTESENDKPWCLTFSIDPKFAYMIQANNINVLKEFNDYIKDFNIILHNAKYDLPILIQMGIQVNKFEDTMVMAYLLQDQPKGLKSLAYRLTNIKMEDYNSVVASAQQSRALVYLISILDHVWPDPEPIEILQKNKIHIKHPQNIAKKVKRILNDFKKNSELNLWERWHRIGLAEGRKQVEDKLGLMPQGTLADIPFKQALRYACRDAAATLAIYRPLKQRIIDEGLLETYERDLEIIRWLNMAESNGMRIDIDYLRNLSKYFDSKMEELRIEIECHYMAAGYDHIYINPSSTQQTAEILYNIGLLKSKTESTDSHTLDRIRSKHPIVNLITEYRELKKLRGTYSEALPMRANKNGIIHTTINNTRTATGRLSSSNPNLQNIPMRTETGRKIKQAFIAPPGCVLLSSDYSQIEMRLTAHDSQDPIMLKIFHNNEDIHTKTAAWIFEKPESEIDPQLERYPVKRVGFGIIYGVSGAGLGDIMRSEGRNESDSYWDNLIREWFKIYKGVKQHIDICKYNTRLNGYVRDFCGRYRLLPGAKSDLTYIKNEAMRQAVNVPAQSGAGQIIKEAMRQLTPMYNDLAEGGKYIVKPVMQIHDDLLHYISEEIISVVAPIIKTIMENAIKLSVPVKVDQKIGHNWLEMEKI